MFVAASMLGVAIPASHADSDIRGGAAYEEGGAKAAIWMVDPGSDLPVSATPGYVPADPYQYKADLHCQSQTDELDVGCLPNQLKCPKRPGDEKPGVPVVWKYAPKSIVNPAWTDWSSKGEASCLYDIRPEELLKLIAARISSAFEKLPFSPSKVSLQPAPHTLKGAETNIYAEASKQDFDITLLGQSVHLTATPVEYTYNYGDGSTLGPTPVSGGPLPEDEWGTKTRTSHVYTATGNYPVSVTTSFTGTYSVNGGPPLPITGRGSATSAPQTIQVWRSITKNYADNCIQNPHGEGC
ncbi:PKD domain-containing protein [Pseudarthrobacter sp. J1763]|uniref:PKD domain-containing protein n=1 Tax=Pseudarthrobacter sp. J1763 TaxID=3420445 RepID=UPI003D2E7C64